MKLNILLRLKQIVTRQQLKEKAAQRPHIRQRVSPRPLPPVISVCVLSCVDRQLQHLRRLCEFSASVLRAELVLIASIHPALAKITDGNPEIVLQINLQVNPQILAVIAGR